MDPFDKYELAHGLLGRKGRALLSAALGLFLLTPFGRSYVITAALERSERISASITAGLCDTESPLWRAFCGPSLDTPAKWPSETVTPIWHPV